MSSSFIRLHEAAEELAVICLEHAETLDGLDRAWLNRYALEARDLGVTFKSWGDPDTNPETIAKQQRLRHRLGELRYLVDPYLKKKPARS